MKRLAMIGGWFVLALAAPAIGQVSTPVCDGCSNRPLFAMYGWIDSPSSYMPQEYGPNFMIMGWVFDCRSGNQPPFVAVLDHNMALEGVHGAQPVRWITQYTVTRGIDRPDVQDAYRGACPRLSSAVGYGVTVNEPLAPGQHFLTVFWTTGDGLARSAGVPVTVP